jgi:hypothetical protein
MSFILRQSEDKNEDCRHRACTSIEDNDRAVLLESAQNMWRRAEGQPSQSFTD